MSVFVCACLFILLIVMREFVPGTISYFLRLLYWAQYNNKH